MVTSDLFFFIEGGSQSVLRDHSIIPKRMPVVCGKLLSKFKYIDYQLFRPKNKLLFVFGRVAGTQKWPSQRIL